LCNRQVVMVTLCLLSRVSERPANARLHQHQKESVLLALKAHDGLAALSDVAR
jgi:hypothetical protein